MQDVLDPDREHGVDHVHRHEGLFLKAVRADQNDIAGEQHHDQVLSPDLRPVENTAQDDLAHDDGKDCQRQDGEDPAQEVVELVDAIVDCFDGFHQKFTPLS